MSIKVSLLWHQLKSKGGPLSAYNYELIFKSGHKHQNADSMSCLPFRPDDCEESSVLENYVLMTELRHSPTTSKDIASYSAQDPIIANVMDILIMGGPLKLRNSVNLT